MSYFENIALLKAPMAYDLLQPQFVMDLIEICSLAAVAEKDVTSVRIPVDVYNDNIYEDYKKHLKNHPVDLVGISSMTGSFNNALKLAEMSKRADKFVVMGGYHASALPEEVLKSPFVDAVIIGEGEDTFRDLVLNGPSGDVPGLAIKKDGGILFTGERPLIQDLDSLPFPLRRARPERFGEAGDQYSMDTIYTSRGCPRQCSFCANDIVNKRWRGRSPENIVEEMALLHDPDRKKFLKLWDANFLTGVKRIEKLCDLMIERDFTNFKICVETGVKDVIRAEEIMPKLLRVGISHVALGIESPNEETLKSMNKRIKSDECSKAVQILNKNSIKAQGFFIIGHYNENEDDTRKYPEYAESLGLRNAIFMIMTPYPGTRVYQEYKAENKLKSYNWDLYNNFGTTVETKSMDTRKLKMMNAYCWGKYYVRFSFLNNSKPAGFVSSLIINLLSLYFPLKIDDSNSREDIKDYLFAFLNSSCCEYKKAMPKKSSLTLDWFKEYNLRIAHSPGKMLDFKIFPSGSELHLTIKEAVRGSAPKGIVMALDDIVNLGSKLTTNKLVAVASRIENMKNMSKSSSKLKKYISLVCNRDVYEAGFEVVRHMLPATIKGVVNMSVKSIYS
jgi:magnesium-protoporphyrin IX monomethyl ester (oxidative) cyclase